MRNLVRQYFRNKHWRRKQFLRDLRNLQKRELIQYRELRDSRTGEVEIVLTKQGKHEMLRYSLDEIALNITAPWDQTWRLILFDIPHAKRQARDALRGKLLQLGFYALQKSVFITPRQCEREIDFIAAIFDVRKHILILPVSRFEGDEKLQHYFRI